VLLVCAGLITLLVIIYKGHSPSLVRAKSQEVLEVVFAGALCYTGLTGVAHRSNRCLLWSPVLDRSSPPVWPVGTVSSKFSGTKSLNLPSRLSIPSKWHQGRFRFSFHAYRCKQLVLISSNGSPNIRRGVGRLRSTRSSPRLLCLC
jgi:hypothetical protein